MKRPTLFQSSILLALLAVVPPPTDAAQSIASARFDAFFTGKTLRFDYYHSGTSSEEHISLDRIRLEGDWAGRIKHLLDDTNLGKYLFVVVDPETNLPLYSAGFASIYGEWETTGEAASGAWRTFHESQRFPEPRKPVQLVLRKRGGDGTFREISSHLVDPTSRFVDRSPLPKRGQPWALQQTGAPRQKVDLLILGDGYSADEIDDYRRDVERVAEALLSFPPFSKHRDAFNVWGIDSPAEASGITQPRAGRWLETPLALTYNAFDSERYLLTFDNRRWRDLAALAPYDALILIANSRQYGGGGIFNLYTTAAVKSAQMPYLVVHEFGHAFAGLADEYYTSQVAYENFTAPGTEPWEPNITALLDPHQLKWRELVSEETPIPTPWNQGRYDEVSLAFQEERQALRAAGAEEEVMDAYFARVKEATTRLLSEEVHAGHVGAFEGAGYQAKGLYRPAIDCIMFSRNPSTFCPVCSLAIERVLRLYTE